MSLHITPSGMYIVWCDICHPHGELPEQPTEQAANEVAARLGFERNRLASGARSDVCPRCVKHRVEGQQTWHMMGR